MTNSKTSKPTSHKPKLQKKTAAKQAMFNKVHTAINTQDKSYSRAIEVARAFREGVPKSSVAEIMHRTRRTPADIAQVLGISERTVRTYRTREELLPPLQTEQLFKYDRLLSLGQDTFGSLETFDRWLNKPAFGLDNEKPRDLLTTSEGINLVIDEVERIAHGEFA